MESSSELSRGRVVMFHTVGEVVFNVELAGFIVGIKKMQKKFVLHLDRYLIYITFGGIAENFFLFLFKQSV